MWQVLFKKLLMQWPVNQVPMRRQLITTTTATFIPLALQFSSVAHAMIWTAACQASLSITNSWNLLKLMSIESVMLSNHLILYRPLLLLPSIFHSTRVFLNESKYWNFSFNICPSNDYSGMISFRMDRLDLLVVQGTLKSFLQHHSSKASVLWCSDFITVQLSHPFKTTGKP